MNVITKALLLAALAAAASAQTTLAPFVGICFGAGLLGAEEVFDLCGGRAHFDVGPLVVAFEGIAAGPYNGAYELISAPSQSFSGWEAGASSRGDARLSDRSAVGWDLRWTRTSVYFEPSEYNMRDHAVDVLYAGTGFGQTFRGRDGELGWGISAGERLARCRKATGREGRYATVVLSTVGKGAVSPTVSMALGVELLVDVYAFDGGGSSGATAKVIIGPEFGL